MKKASGYIIAFLIGVLIMYLIPIEQPPVVSADFEAKEKQLRGNIDSLNALVQRSETTIDSIKSKLASDSVEINSKILDRHEEINSIQSATVSDDLRWLTTRYR